VASVGDGCVAGRCRRSVMAGWRGAAVATGRVGRGGGAWPRGPCGSWRRRTPAPLVAAAVVPGHAGERAAARARDSWGRVKVRRVFFFPLVEADSAGTLAGNTALK
jgi:hypothetical protein